MTHPNARTALQLRSLVKSTGELSVSLTQVPVPAPADNEVLVRIEAAPINPSDLGLLFAGASGFCGMARLLGLMPWNRRTAG